MTPEEAWSGSKPSVEHLRPFVCIAFTHVLVQHRSKLDSKTIQGVFVGYCSQSKAYRVFDPVRRKINVTRDIIFDERFEDDNNRASSRPNRESTENPDHHQKSREVQNQNQSMPEQERQSNLSAKNRDYKPPDLQALGNDDVQNALKEISRAASRIANIRTEELL